MKSAFRRPEGIHKTGNGRRLADRSQFHSHFGGLDLQCRQSLADRPRPVLSEVFLHHVLEFEDEIVAKRIPALVTRDEKLVFILLEAF
jgi:hypothetical protein